MTTLYSHTIRLLTCPSCGAPIDASLGGGQLRCGYCGAASVIQRRDEQADLERAQRGRASAMSESERFAQLRHQDQGPTPIPEGLTPWVQNGALRRDCVEPAQREWQAAHQQLRGGAGFGAAERFFHLTVLLAEHLDERRQRASLETAAELLDDERHRHVVRCMLARLAAQHRDVQAAEDWLSTCNPRPTDLVMDTAYRHAAATLAAARGDAKRILELLGHRYGDVPLADREQLACDLLRAHGLELGGDLQALVEVRHWIQVCGVPAVQHRLTAFAPLSVCPRSFAQARHERSTADDEARLAALTAQREALSTGTRALAGGVARWPVWALILMIPVAAIRCTADADPLFGLYGIPLCPQVCDGCEGPTRTVTPWTQTGASEWSSNGALYFCETPALPLGDWDAERIEGLAYQMGANELGTLAVMGSTFLILLMLIAPLVPLRGWLKHAAASRTARDVDAEIVGLSSRLGRPPPRAPPLIDLGGLVKSVVPVAFACFVAAAMIALSLAT